MTRRRLFIVTAPSGAGKTSLLRALLQRDDRLAVSVSHTTRPARPGEQDGVHYHFTAPQDFETLRDEDGFLEWAEVFGHHYGTARAEVARLHDAGHDVILEIDWQGARKVRQVLPDAIGIFILPPSLAVLEQRLRDRATDDEAVIARRLAEAQSDIRHCRDFDHCVINDDFDAALDQLHACIRNPDQPDDDPRPCHRRVLGMTE